MKVLKSSYEGCSKMATIFLMVWLGKKELASTVLVENLIGKEDSIIKTLKTYITG